MISSNCSIARVMGPADPCQNEASSSGKFEETEALDKAKTKACTNLDLAHLVVANGCKWRKESKVYWRSCSDTENTR